MRIGHYMQGIGHPGGIATYIRRISEIQSNYGHKVFFFDTYPSTHLQGEVAESNIRVHNDQDLFEQFQVYKLDILHLHITVNETAPSNITVIRTIHDNNPYCPSGSRYLKRWGQPCDRAYSLTGCFWGHLVDHCGSIRPKSLHTNFERTWQEMEVLKKIPTFANSQFVKDQMVRSGYTEDKIRVLRLPAPERREYFLPPNDGIPHFLFLGRITPEKGYNWLLESLATVKHPVHLDFAGQGNSVQEQAIRSLTQGLGLNDRVTFHGWVNEEQVFNLLKQARAVIFPSVWHEPAGLVTLEAAAAGRAVIASRVGGIPEYAERLQNALLVEPNDVSGLARSIERLAEDWELARSLGEEGYQRVGETFSLKQHIQQLTELYKGAIAGSL